MIMLVLMTVEVTIIGDLPCCDYIIIQLYYIIHV